MNTEVVVKKLDAASFLLLSVAILIAPWFFGAWEAWWFWPFAGLIFSSGLLFGARLLIESCFPERRRRRHAGRSMSSVLADSRLSAFLCYIPFLLYLLARQWNVDVRLDGERVLLLHFTAFLIAIVLVFAASRDWTRRLHALILVNLCFMGIFGLVNHYCTGSKTVFGVAGFPQYYQDGRASGPYFCPDHYSGLMELLLCLCLPLLSARVLSRPRRMLAVVAAVIAVAGIVMSKSRGGGLTLLVLCTVWLAWGVLERRPRERWLWRGAAVSLATALTVALCLFGHDYVTRFVSYFGYTQRDGSYQSSGRIVDVVKRQDRYQMMSAALRAWRDYPMLGIGPGMHSHLWPHYAATPDGDRASGRWPTFPNYRYESNYVHGDWVQLLEELGLVGFVLFLAPAVCVSARFLRCLRRTGSADPGPVADENISFVSGAWLAIAAMAFHSLGDFNLNIPGTAWLFAAIVAIGWRHSSNRGSGSKGRGVEGTVAE